MRGISRKRTDVSQSWRAVSERWDGTMPPDAEQFARPTRWRAPSWHGGLLNRRAGWRFPANHRASGLKPVTPYFAANRFMQRCPTCCKRFYEGSHQLRLYVFPSLTLSCCGGVKGWSRAEARLDANSLRALTRVGQNDDPCYYRAAGSESVWECD